MPNNRGRSYSQDKKEENTRNVVPELVKLKTK